MKGIYSGRGERRFMTARCHGMPCHIILHYVRKRSRHMTIAVLLIHQVLQLMKRPSSTLKLHQITFIQVK